jgi:prolyl oligopeptidase
MKPRRVFVVSLFLWPFFLAASNLPDAGFARKYPDAGKSDQVDDYNGTKVADPYRWLEDPDSPESRKWIEAENKVTFDFLKTIPTLDAIKKRLTALWD